MEPVFDEQTLTRAVASCALKAMLYEVSTTPKPGLVDRNNSGSHRDMDFFTFLDSAAALAPWFGTMFRTGLEGAGAAEAELFARLRAAGIAAERDMLTASCGANTHKGLIYSLGILCASLGAEYAACRVLPLPLSLVLEFSSRLGRCSLADFRLPQSQETAGLSFYRDHRITGVRGEAAAGFPSALNTAYVQIKRWTDQGLPLNDAAAIALLHLIAVVTDTNMIHRSDMAAAKRKMAEAAGLACAITPENFQPLLLRLDEEYIRENLSPGGCADLLSMGLMFWLLEKDELITVDVPRF